MSCFFLIRYFSDLDLFSSEERESVYVKEGQGAVLLCAPPPHHPGEQDEEDVTYEFVIDFFFSPHCRYRLSVVKEADILSRYWR